MSKIFHIILLFNIFGMQVNIVLGSHFDKLPKDIILEILKFCIYDFPENIKEFKKKYKKLRLISKKIKNIFDNNIESKEIMNCFEDHIESLIEKECNNCKPVGIRVQKQQEASLAASCGSKRYFENLNLDFNGSFFDRSSKESFVISFLIYKEVLNNYRAPLILAIEKYPDLAIFIMEKFLLKNLKRFNRNNIEILSFAVRNGQSEYLKDFFNESFSDLLRKYNISDL